MPAVSIRTQVIGAAGEALITCKLLEHEIDSARTNTDAGIDLVMYESGTQNAATIEVKATWESVPAGGKGASALGWVSHPQRPAQWRAFVDLSRDKARLFTMQ